MFDFTMNLYSTLFLLTAVNKSFALYPLDIAGGPVHSIGSTIQSTFSGQLDKYTTYNIVWRFNNTSVCNIFIQRDMIFVGICNSSNTTYYNFHSIINATLTDGLLNATFTYNNIKNETSPIILIVEDAVSSYTFNATTFYVTVCENLIANDRLVVSGGTNAHHKAVAKYTCTDSVLVLNNQYDENIDSYLTVCQSNAQWSPEKDVDCWYAPTVNINVTQANAASNEVLVIGTYVTINCYATTTGKPESTFTLYFKDNETIAGVIFLDSSYNGAIISCQMRNNYVNQVDESAGYSPKTTLDVLYQPEPQYGAAIEQEYAQIGDNYTIVIQFSANPRVKVSDTAMYFNENKMELSKASINYQNNLHTYRYLLTEVSEESFGTYILSTRSPSPELAGRVTNFTVVLNSTKLISTTTIPESTSLSIETGGLSTAAIAAISTCVGIVLTIIATSAVWWWMLKRMGKGEESMKHENKESAYEPTYVDGQPLESAYEVVNRETIEDNMRVAPQEQTNVNSAYEVIR